MRYIASRLVETVNSKIRGIRPTLYEFMHTNMQIEQRLAFTKICTRYLQPQDAFGNWTDRLDWARQIGVQRDVTLLLWSALRAQSPHHFVTIWFARGGYHRRKKGGCH